jgi:hypothetical protein
LAVAVLTFLPKQPRADVWFVPLAGGAPTKVATVERAPGTPLTAAAIAGTDLVAVVASPRRARDVTWSGALIVVSPGREPRPLLADVHAGGTPVAAPAGILYVVRGKAGAERNPADKSPGYRRDKLELVAVDARSGAARVVTTDFGDALFLIGLLGEDLVAYRVGAAGAAAEQSRRAPAAAEIVAVNVRSGTTRTLLSPAPAFARDFSLDALAQKLWFTARLGSDAPGDGEDDRRWGVHGLDLASGKLTVVATGPSMGLTPHGFPGGEVAYACAPGGESAKGEGLCVRGGRGSEPERVWRPLGAGRDQLQAVACTADGSVAFGVHQSEDARLPFPIPFSWDVREERGHPLALPAGRLVFAGVVAPAAESP